MEVAPCPGRPHHLFEFGKEPPMPLVELGSYPNAMEAAMVRGVLDAAGIDSVAFDGGMNIADSAGWMIPVRVMVLDDDLAAARAALPKD